MWHMHLKKWTKHDFLKYFSIFGGAAILAFGLYNIHSRCPISEGGVIGLSLLLHHWLHISPGISGVVMDLIAIIAGTLVLKNSFLWDSIFAAVSYGVWYSFFELFDPVLPDFSHNPLAASILGGLFVGLGTALMVMHGCGAGADDSLALIWHAKTGKSISAFYVISDLSVLTLSLSYIPLQKIAWSLMTVMISSAVIAVVCREKNEEGAPE